MIEVGDIVPLTCQVTRPDGSLADAGAMRLGVVLPDGVTTLQAPGDLTLTHVTGSGQYACDVPTTVVGQHSYSWIATGTNAGVQADIFNVDAAGPRLISLDEARTALRGMKPCTSPADLELLRENIIVATRAIELDLNRIVVARTIVETHQAYSRIILRQGPARQILSIDVSGQSVATDTWWMRTEGILENRYGWTVAGPWGSTPVTVTYRAGDSTIDPVLRKVCRAAVRRMWQLAQQSPQLPPEDLVADDLTPVVGTLTTLELDAYERLRRTAIA